MPPSPARHREGESASGAPTLSLQTKWAWEPLIWLLFVRYSLFGFLPSRRYSTLGKE